MRNLKIIAGPCSIDRVNINQAIEIGKMPEVYGVRCVGLKSVTSPRAFMGIDQEWYFRGQEGEAPSLKLARRIVQMTGKKVAFELMDSVQLVDYLDSFFKGKVFVWNPAIAQLGYPIYRLATTGKHLGWKIGLKNPKWWGDEETEIKGVPVNNGEKNWYGNAKFSEAGGIIPVMIYRGVNIDNSEGVEYRNFPMHSSAKKMKDLGYKVWLDPSHICGEKMRHQIVEKTLEWLNLRDGKGGFLYEGLLIEVGDSQTDTGQHITLEEFKELIKRIKEFREI